MSAALHAYPRAWTHANKYIGMSGGIDKPQAFTCGERENAEKSIDHFCRNCWLGKPLACYVDAQVGEEREREGERERERGSRKGLVERGMEQQTHSEVIYLRLATGIDWFEWMGGGGWQCKWRKCEVSFPMDFIKRINRWYDVLDSGKWGYKFVFESGVWLYGSKEISG